MSAEKIEAVAAILAKSRRVLFITGAGLSADSGLPTYRGIGGLYDDGGTEEGLPIEVALSGTMLRRRPEMTWKYVHQVESACRGAQHNRGHEVLADMQSRLEAAVILTQNVDGFHRDAGSERVIDIHGDLHDLECLSCTYGARVDDYSGLPALPRCPECTGVLRPRVVLFGEMLPRDKVAELEHELSRGFDAVFSIGTTSVFPYIAGPVLSAKKSGTPTVEINPGQSEVSEVVDLRLQMRAMEALEQIWRSRSFGA